MRGSYFIFGWCEVFEQNKLDEPALLIFWFGRCGVGWKSLDEATLKELDDQGLNALDETARNAVDEAGLVKLDDPVSNRSYLPVIPIFYTKNPHIVQK